MQPQVLIHDPDVGGWRRLERPREIIAVERLTEVPGALARVEEAVERRGWQAVGWIAYEAAPAFDPALTVCPARPGWPLVWFALGEELAAAPVPASAGFPPAVWTPSVSEAEYGQAFAEIRRRIARGETYQVNYTYRLRTPAAADSAAAWFGALAGAARAPYAVFSETDDFAVCSVTPELFFRRQGAEVLARPMKGTAPRLAEPAADARLGAALRVCPKNRAENAMIVDMLRNDLGRVARIGGVAPGECFRLEGYPSVWQLTSDVTARTDATTAEVLAALFPCASVTGAPKARTMRIIAELERGPRGIYCGAVGWWGPGRRARFGVGIRTLVLDKRRGEAEYGVGGGVVWDSRCGQEYRETLAKARVLRTVREDFQLLETLLWTPTEGFRFLELHLRRLQSACRRFNFRYREGRVRGWLKQLAASLPAEPQRCRLLVARDGAISGQAAALGAGNCRPPAAKLAAWTLPVGVDAELLRHKTTARQVYEQARQECPAVDDVLLFDPSGDLTETTIANIVLRLDGEWLTPEAGQLLPGTARAWVLGLGIVREARLSLADCRRASSIYLLNSVRGWRRGLPISGPAGGREA